MSGNLPSPSTASFRSIRPVPLLSLAQPALALGEDLAVGEPGEDNNVGEIWNVITRAADLVKDGERLENLAWRHWGQPRRNSHASRRLSMSSNGTASTSSLHTLHTPNDPAPFLYRSRSFEKRTFGGALKLLLEKDENNFKDWVEEAKKHLPPMPSPSPPPMPTISVPDTPVANVEIRLVEPTPVPSRVGSLGGSMGASGLLGATAAIPPALREDLNEVEEELIQEYDHKARMTPIEAGPSSSRPRSPKKRGKFFVQSSPTKGSGSDTSHPSHPSPTAPTRETTLPTPPRPSKHDRRRSSGDSSTGMSSKVKGDLQQPPAQKRQVSLSTMRGKYHAEKRRMAEEHKKQQAKDNEESGWEDEDENEVEEDWSDEEEGQTKGKAKIEDGKPVSPEPSDKRNQQQGRRSSYPSRPQASRSKSHTQLDLGALLTRRTSRHEGPNGTPSHNNAPPPPAPTPLRRMSKKERAQAAAERAKIEAQLEAQRQREMFAKQQIFGDKRPAAHTGLLANALRGGASMVNLQSAVEPSIRPSPTHGQLASLAFSPAPAPSLLRSKSAVAMPVQTGVSVTVPPHALHEASSKKGQSSSQERAKAQVELESESEASDADAEYLNTTKTRQKLAEMAARRDARTQQAAPAVPQALPSGPRVNEYGIVQPMTPTTRRRNIIMAEMSESLRRNVVLEREKSAGLGLRPKSALSQAQPSASTSSISQRLPSHSSEDNLARHGDSQPLERRSSQPTRSSHGVGYLPPIYSQANSPVSATASVGSGPSPVHRAAPLPDLQRRRPQPTLLGGANYLRPLTRASTDTATVKTTSTLNRTQSSAALTECSSGSVSPRVPEAPPMVRRSTDHEGLQMSQMDRDAKRRELVKRAETTDTSYRFHGW